MHLLPYGMALSIYAVALFLLARLEPGILLGIAFLIFLVDASLLFEFGSEPYGLLALTFLGIGSLLTPLNPQRKRLFPHLAKKKRKLRPPSEKEPLEERYQILGKIGTGGMATVYQAKRWADDLVVALKVPQGRYAKEPRFLQRLHREAEVLKQLEHPNIVKVYEHGKAGDTHFIAMELVEGPSLDELIADRRLTPELALQILLPVAEALEYLHEQGFLHRDLKPSNIMIHRDALQGDKVDPAGVRLMDFGIAEPKQSPKLGSKPSARVGTPTYMSPEQAKGKPLNEKSDVYSLGIVLYEALVGNPPFQGDFEQVAKKQVHERPVPPIQQNPDLHPLLNDLVLRMLEKDPKDRPDLREVIQTLKNLPHAIRQELRERELLAVVVEAPGGSIRLINDAGLPLRAFGEYRANDLTADLEGMLWAVFFDFSGDRGMVRRFDPEGRELLATGTYGLKLGEFFNPIAITSSKTGYVFVLDSESQAITRMRLDGQAELRFGGRGPGRGTFQKAVQLAAWNDLFVLDLDGRQIQRLDLEGNYKDRFILATSANDPTPRPLQGLGVDQEGNLLIYDARSRKVRVLSPEGQLRKSFSLPLQDDEDESALVDLVAQEDGTIYALRRGSARIYRLKDGERVREIALGVPIRALALWRR